MPDASELARLAEAAKASRDSAKLSWPDTGEWFELLGHALRPHEPWILAAFLAACAPDTILALCRDAAQAKELAGEVGLFVAAFHECKPWIHSRAGGRRPDRGDLVAVHESQRNALVTALIRLEAAARRATEGETDA